MQKKTIKVVVTGPAGQVGYALLFRIGSGQMFGPNQPIILHLLELEERLPILNGIAMELDDCAFPLLKDIVCTSDYRIAMEDVHWAILLGSAPRKKGMKRSDLLAMNGRIFAPQGKALNTYANETVKVLVVGNPCNTNCLIAMCHARDLSPSQFFAMTLLDQNRAQSLLAKKAQVSVEEVQIFIWGNHSSTQYPDIYNAMIGGKPAPSVISTEWLENNLIPQVRDRGEAIMLARGASSAGSAANAIVETGFYLTHNTPEGKAFSVASYSHGQYNVPEGLIFSFPSINQEGNFSVIEGIPHNRFGQKAIEASIKELEEEKKQIEKMQLIN